MHTCEALDFWGLHKNMNCAFPLRKEIVKFLVKEILAEVPTNSLS